MIEENEALKQQLEHLKQEVAEIVQEVRADQSWWCSDSEEVADRLRELGIPVPRNDVLVWIPFRMMAGSGLDQVPDEHDRLQDALHRGLLGYEMEEVYLDSFVGYVNLTYDSDRVPEIKEDAP